MNAPETQAKNTPNRSRFVISLLLVFTSLAAGLIGGWIGRGIWMDNQVATQEGVFSINGPEEKTIHFPKPFAESPLLQVTESSEGVRVLVVHATHFKVTCPRLMTVTNQPWKAIGRLAP
jgi:hypothetical protein